MTPAFSVLRCTRCGLAAWPAPALCRACGCRELRSEQAGAGLVEETTAADPVVLGTVRTDAGPIVVARIEGALPGERVALQVEDGALTARPGA